MLHSVAKHVWLTKLYITFKIKLNKFFQVQAVDYDEGLSGSLEYSIYASGKKENLGLFNIDKTNGNIFPTSLVLEYGEKNFLINYKFLQILSSFIFIDIPLLFQRRHYSNFL